MTEQLRVFVSHASADRVFCRALVDSLTGAGADVWYDERNLGSGVLRREIMRELSARPVFLVVLSRAAFASTWVQDECEWAYNLYRRKPERLILPVVGAPYDTDDFDTLLYIESMKRIEATGHQPYPTDVAIRHLLRALALTPAGETPVSTAPQPTESVDDLLTRGKALMAQRQYAAAQPLFERATHLAPNSFAAWTNLSQNLLNLMRWHESLAACDRAIALDGAQAGVWVIKATALSGLGHHQDAMAAIDHALALDSNNAYAWNGKGASLLRLHRYQEALAADDQAIALNPNLAAAWLGKGFVLFTLKLYQDALAALDQAIILEPNYAPTWVQRAACLRALGRKGEAKAAEQRARELGWQG